MLTLEDLVVSGALTWCWAGSVPGEPTPYFTSLLSWTTHLTALRCTVFTEKLGNDLTCRVQMSLGQDSCQPRAWQLLLNAGPPPLGLTPRDPMLVVLELQFSPDRRSSVCGKATLFEVVSLCM